MEIEFSGPKQFFHLNSRDFSAFDYEQEVLLQDGIQYEVIDVEVEM